MELQETMAWVSGLAVREVMSADFAVVVLCGSASDVPRAVGASDAVALDLADAERDGAGGPCLATLDTGLVHYVEQTTDPHGKWPMFRATCVRHGVLSALFVPLHAGGVRVGALGLYAESALAYSDAQIIAAQEFAVCAAVVVTNAADYWKARGDHDTLARALESRALIDQAKGILMHTLTCGPDEAFTLLAEQSQFENRKVREIASELVARTSESGRLGRSPHAGHVVEPG